MSLIMSVIKWLGQCWTKQPHNIPGLERGVLLLLTTLVTQGLLDAKWQSAQGFQRILQIPRVRYLHNNSVKG